MYTIEYYFACLNFSGNILLTIFLFKRKPIFQRGFYAPTNAQSTDKTNRVANVDTASISIFTVDKRTAKLQRCFSG